tara:strand:+ start:2601 stop:2930 length:330 start_codon:yes stop_codon:yes gene_type:complete
MPAEEIEIGDLVCLEDDEDFMIGIGIVIEIASNNHNVIEDFFGLTEIETEIIEVDSVSANEIAKKLYLHKPVYLVLWSGDKNYFSEGDRASPLWFFKNELKLVNKVTKD